jgi:Ser/Thr protein kinase RdoA (MazF antagonist)
VDGRRAAFSSISTIAATGRGAGFMDAAVGRSRRDELQLQEWSPGYREFHDFNTAELAIVEALRTLA